VQHPLSFLETANGNGLTENLKISYRVNDQSSVGLKTDFLNFWTRSGTDKAFFADGTTQETRFNTAKWTSWGLSFVLDHHF
jgi:hypothetical protein